MSVSHITSYLAVGLEAHNEHVKYSDLISETFEILWHLM